MATPHITAAKGDIAPTVLMPGDPLRAKFIAETYLEDAVEFNRVRGMLGFTGRFRGKRVSVMGSGMGMPSIGIYSYELFTQYEVQRILRVGSAGAYDGSLKLFDVLLADSAWSESTFAKTQSGYADEYTYPSKALNEAIAASAEGLGKPLRRGAIHSADVFYVQGAEGTPYWQTLRDEKGCLAVEMESFALFHNAAVCGKEAACLLTISDSFVTEGLTTPEQREKSFGEMIEIALGIL